MAIMVKTIGILICCYAAILAFSPETARKIVAYVKEGKKLYYAAALRMILGILLIIGAFSCTAKNVVLAIGILSLASGVAAAAFGLVKMTAFVDWWLAKSNSVLRLMAVLAFLFGAVIIYAV